MNIFMYFDNVVDPFKAHKLHSFCVARSIYHVTTLIQGHGKEYKCHCFKCLICRLLMRTLLSRKHKKLLYNVTK